MRRGIKKQEGENLTDANIKKVIRLLSAEKPITKKKRVVFLILAIIPLAFLKLLRIMKAIKSIEKPEKHRSVADPLTMLKLQKS